MTEKKDIVPYDKKSTTEIVAVSGGKGGIGKTFFSVNFAVELKKRGYRVLIFDSDINLSNVNLLMHIDGNNSFQDFLDNKIPIEGLIQKGVGGVDVLFAGDDMDKIVSFEDGTLDVITDGLSKIEMNYDYIIIDTQAGMNDFNIRLMVNSDHIILITNPEITALVDLYRLIKVMAAKKDKANFKVVINKAKGGEGAVKIYEKIYNTVAEFKIKATLSLLGYINDDSLRVIESIQKRTPVTILHEYSPLTGCFKLITDTFIMRKKEKRKVSFFQSLFGR